MNDGLLDKFSFLSDFHGSRCRAEVCVLWKKNPKVLHPTMVLASRLDLTSIGMEMARLLRPSGEDKYLATVGGLVLYLTMVTFGYVFIEGDLACTHTIGSRLDSLARHMYH